MNDEEISCNLRLLKRYSREFDAYEARWKVSGERTFYQAMVQAEKNYVSLSDWLWIKELLSFGIGKSGNISQFRT